MRYIFSSICTRNMQTKRRHLETINESRCIWEWLSAENYVRYLVTYRSTAAWYTKGRIRAFNRRAMAQLKNCSNVFCEEVTFVSVFTCFLASTAQFIRYYRQKL